jgi:hypothetical protein
LPNVGGHSLQSLKTSMTNSDILKTASKVFGLYFMVQALMSLRDLFYYLTGTFSSKGDNEGIFMILTSQIYMGTFNLAAGVILIFKADWVASKLAPDPAGHLAVGLDKKGWIELALIVISGLTILNSFPEILYKGVYYVYFNDYDEAERQFFWTNKNKADIFYSIFKFAVGLFVLLNARNFAGRLQKIGDKDDKLGG